MPKVLWKKLNIWQIWKSLHYRLKVLSLKLDLCRTWKLHGFFLGSFKETDLCKTNFGFCFEVFEFYVSCDGKNGITQLSMLNVITFHELLECNLGMARVATLICKFIYFLKFYSNMVMECASKASTNVRKLSNVLCVFFFYCFLCVLCLSITTLTLGLWLR